MIARICQTCLTKTSSKTEASCAHPVGSKTSGTLQPAWAVLLCKEVRCFSWQSLGGFNRVFQLPETWLCSGALGKRCVRSPWQGQSQHWTGLGADVVTGPTIHLAKESQPASHLSAQEHRCVLRTLNGVFPSHKVSAEGAGNRDAACGDQQHLIEATSPSSHGRGV